MQTSFQPASRVSWLRLAGLTAFGFALGTAGNTVDPVVLSIRVLELVPGDNRNTALGLTTAAGLAVAVVTQPLIGALSDRTRSRWGRRIPYFVAGTALAIFSIFAVALAPTFGLVIVSVLAYQLAANSVQAPWQALIPEHVPSTQRGAAAGLKAIFDILAFISGRRLSGLLAAEGQLTGAVSIAALVFIAMLVVTILALRGRRPAIQVPPQGGVRRALTAALQLDWRANPAFTWWFLNRFLFWGGLVSLNTFLLFYMVDVLAMEQGQAARFFAQVSTILGGMVILFTLPAGWLADRLGRRPLVALAGLLAALGTGLALAWPSAGSLALAVGIVGIAAGIFLSANWALVTDVVPPKEAARYLGIANIASAGASLLVRFSGGFLIDQINLWRGDSSSGYQALYALNTLAFLIASLAILKVPKWVDRVKERARQPVLDEPPL